MAPAETYALLKAGHIGLALASGALFACRGVGVLLGARLAMAPLVRRASVALDTALLAAAVALLVLLRLNPVTTPWLAFKMALLAAYIGFGTLALRRAPTRTTRAIAFAAALGCYAAIVWVARHKVVFGLG